MALSTRVLRPLAGKPRTYWHVAGDILWRGDGRPTWITEQMARDLRELFAEETAAFHRAGNPEAALRSCGLWLQLTLALDGLDQWRRAVTAASKQEVA